MKRAILGETTIVKKILQGNPDVKDRYIADRKALERVVNILKQSGYKIVLTQGVYDLFHVGHKRYLEEAKQQGDILIVGVDSDELTRQRKGPKRPFDAFEDRIEILAGLRAVDIVTVRHVGEHFHGLIKTVKPDVLIMSQTTVDFGKEDQKKLRQYYGIIKVLPAQASTTTTAKLRRLMVDGAEELGKKVSEVINGFLQGNQNKK